MAKLNMKTSPTLKSVHHASPFPKPQPGDDDLQLDIGLEHTYPASTWGHGQKYGHHRLSLPSSPIHKYLPAKKEGSSLWDGTRAAPALPGGGVAGGVPLGPDLPGRGGEGEGFDGDEQDGQVDAGPALAAEGAEVRARRRGDGGPAARPTEQRVLRRGRVDSVEEGRGDDGRDKADEGCRDHHGGVHGRAGAELFRVVG